MIDPIDSLDGSNRKVFCMPPFVAIALLWLLLGCHSCLIDPADNGKHHNCHLSTKVVFYEVDNYILLFT